ncbi:MAG: secreted PhoX family phosphatase [Gammaproteobacteria bacterium]|jgi:secreted PhoX family phosphatase
MTRSRRDFIGNVAAVTTGLVVPWGDAFANADAYGQSHGNYNSTGRPLRGYGPLRHDPAQVLDLPDGFSYRVISRAGDAMDDGLRVPGLADGMHAFRVGMDTVLVRNHELNVGDRDHAFRAQRKIAAEHLAKLYDGRVGTGGTTTVVLAADGLSVRRQFLSLAGTLRNCAGGATPWGSWLSCEESVVRLGQHGALRDHGYVFEVPAAAKELTDPHPLKAMGRFHREAVAVDPNLGVVYQSEDRADGLFYRFIPEQRGQLSAGGRLQAMVIEGFDGHSTANRRQRIDVASSRQVPARKRLPVSWVDLDEVESPHDDLRQRGRALGATTFFRGEGFTVQRTSEGVCVWFVCTAGGPRGLGQIWCYRPAAGDTAVGPLAAKEQETMELFLQPEHASMLRNGDNLAMAPTDDVLVCEDQPDRQRLMGVTSDGGVYLLARNPRGDSELAGACFARRPDSGAVSGTAKGRDGEVLYLNIQRRGLTLAITGPWSSRDASAQR